MFDAEKFLKTTVGGPAEVSALLRSRFGIHSPSADTCRKWYIRNNISSEWFPLLLAHLEERGGSPISLKKYVSRGRAQ